MSETNTAPKPGGESDRATSGVEIRLENVTKQYGGQRHPAVDSVTMTIPAGETVVFVGPSGCGKTTTMKMINRLIEPTSGRITVGGQDVLRLNPDELRRGIGYAIQQVGLLPHLTVSQNVGLVPGLIGWDKSRIAERTEEMLDLVGLDPAEYRDRFPKQLSGGQQQRVGVARALAADPPVLLMDEPFGAVDPITRGNLQDELMRLQEEMGKTIVFVTHDFDEAVKLGDRIAVLGYQSKILQYDTPEAILANPADETVAGFVGAGAALKQLTLRRVRDIELEQLPTATAGEEPAAFAARLGGRRGAVGLVLDERGRPLRWVTRRDLDRSGSLATAGRPVEDSVDRASTLQDALEALLTADAGYAVVTRSRGQYAGVVGLDSLMGTIRALREQYEDEDGTPDGRPGDGPGGSDGGSGAAHA
ncbi:ABC transporter [Actinoalloteichus sp. AHMU CJ021]|uniref:Osmoprotectant transport system ATP-binding protein n=1 Tax=Actinoalloteichus caeruleus DSM 43889 TaxID=1120930 RepID=A0ABT1JK88_ACTCY|nr:ATP-binding cassette domain-containing protein [Actinoalloteichus caeruleus]AUS78760.1 ABC transporter [Actinoalloteichus sp. AHMU CJ021]MCP2332922.1 osmoprotectant transport system ATP-binding protein [Actinoalloteichus caeruleus DSM 43889]